MIDIKLIKENPEEVIKRFKIKGKDAEADIKRILELDGMRRSLISETEALKAEQNKENKLIPTYKKEGKDVTEIFAKLKDIGNKSKEIDAELKERQSPFRFSMCNIQPGEEIEYCNNPEIKCTVVDDKTVSYQGQSYSLSSLAQLLTGSKYSVAGPRYFKYKGEWLNDIRHRLEG